MGELTGCGLSCFEGIHLCQGRQVLRSVCKAHTVSSHDALTRSATGVNLTCGSERFAVRNIVQTHVCGSSRLGAASLSAAWGLMDAP